MSCMNAQHGIHQSLGETVYSVNVHISVGPKEIRPDVFYKTIFEYIKVYYIFQNCFMVQLSCELRNQGLHEIGT